MVPIMLKIDKNSSEPIYLQIYRQLKVQIISGEIQTGERLKATRVLSEEYHLSRNTILNAYQQLESEGFVRSIIGSGFYVEEIPEFIHEKVSLTIPNSNPEPNKTYRYDFRYGALEPNLYKNTDFRRCLKEAMNELEEKPSLYNGDPMGLQSLREAISTYLFETRDMRISFDQVIITGGHHYSISLLQKILPSSVSTLYMEEPGHNDTFDIFKEAGYTIVPVEVDDNGMKVDQIKSFDKALAYITPSHQFPLGAILPIGRRLQLLKWAKKSSSYIIEDDYDASLRYKEQPIPSLFSLDRNQSVIYLGTFSKSLSPDLRVSYIVLPAGFDYAPLRKHFLLSSPASSLIQLTIEKYISLGFYKTRINKLRNLLRKKHNRILSFFARHYGDRIKIYGIGGGTHFVLALPTDKDQESILSFFHQRDIAVYPTKKYYLQKKQDKENLVLIGYSGIPLEELDDYLDHLKTAIDALTKAA